MVYSSDGMLVENCRCCLDDREKIVQMLLLRGVSTPRTTPGRLYLNGQFECYTLEQRLPVTNVKGSQASVIRDGRYPVQITMSAQWQRVLPLLVNDQDIEIPICAGNTVLEAPGAILAGDAPGQDWLGQSSVAFERLFARLRQASHISIEIRSVSNGHCGPLGAARYRSTTRPNAAQSLAE
jgi:hypothetical protein